MDPFSAAVKTWGEAGDSPTPQRHPGLKGFGGTLGLLGVGYALLN